jgi:hypothetical protein
MPIDLSIPHALLLADPTGVRVVAKSDDFPDGWEEDAVRLVEGFGPRPEGLAVPPALAFLPFGKQHTAVVQFANQLFRVLVLNRKLSDAISDPFAVSDTFPPNWSARGSLPPLAWTPDPPPARTVAEVAEILHHDGPLLLGATQALLDGMRVVIRRDTPDDAVLRRVWKLLPYSTRNELAVATFTFGLDGRFHLSVTPNPPTPLPFGTIGEEQCGDLPEGRYELALQIAAETRNQGEVNRLFTRRSSKDTLKIALALLGIALVAAVASKLLW